jgi:hypothetical protein
MEYFIAQAKIICLSWGVNILRSRPGQLVSSSRRRWIWTVNSNPFGWARTQPTATATRSVRISTTSAGTDRGITASERIQDGRRCRTDSGGGGCGIDSKAHAIRLKPFTAIRDPATTTLSPQVTAQMARRTRPRRARWLREIMLSITTGLRSGWVAIRVVAVRDSYQLLSEALDARLRTGQRWTRRLG